MTTRCASCKRPFLRSNPEHDLLFGMIAMAADNWPVTHEFRPTDPEHLRAWLAMEVGHSELLEVPPEVAVDAQALAVIGLFLCGGKRLFRIGKRDGNLAMLRPRTMNRRDLKVAEFRKMASNVYEVIALVTGITPEQYKQHKDAA